MFSQTQSKEGLMAQHNFHKIKPGVELWRAHPEAKQNGHRYVTLILQLSIPRRAEYAHFVWPEVALIKSLIDKHLQCSGDIHKYSVEVFPKSHELKKLTLNLVSLPHHDTWRPFMKELADWIRERS